MNQNSSFRKLANKDIKEMQKTFFRQKIIFRKLVPYYPSKSLVLDNKTNYSKNLLIQDEITKKNNQYEHKKYDGKKLSKSIHKKLDYFNKAHNKNVSLYNSYKSKYQKFSKLYFICKNINKNKSLKNLRNNSFYENEAIYNLINEYKCKKNINIEFKSMKKDLFSNSALIEGNPKHLEFLYIFNPSKFAKKNNSENERNNNTKIFNYSEPISFGMESIELLKEYKFIKKIDLLSKMKIDTFKGNFNSQNKKDLLKVEEEQAKCNNDKEEIQEEIMKNQNDIIILNQTLKSLNEEINEKNNKLMPLKIESNINTGLSSIYNSDTSRYLNFNKTNNILNFPIRITKINKRNTINLGNNTKYSDEFNKSDLFPKIENKFIKLKSKNINNISKYKENFNFRNSNLKSRLFKSKTMTDIKNFDEIYKYIIKNNYSKTGSVKDINSKKKINQDILNNDNPKTEDIYKFTKNNMGKLGKMKIIKNIEKFLENKKSIYENKNIKKSNKKDYFQYLMNLSNNIMKYKASEDMEKNCNITGREINEEKHNKIINLEEDLKKKGKELLVSLFLNSKKDLNSLDDNINKDK